MAIHFVRRIPGACRFAGALILLLAILHLFFVFALGTGSPVLAFTTILISTNLPDSVANVLIQGASYIIDGPPTVALVSALAAVLGLILLLIGFRVLAAGPVASLLALAIGGWEAYRRAPDAVAFVEGGALPEWPGIVAIVAAILLLLSGFAGLFGAIAYRSQ